MRALIIQHPSAEVKLQDPRDPEVRDKYALPQLGHDEPIRAAIERGDEQMCVCGVPTRHHFTLDLKTWLGCTNAKDRQQGPRNPQRWNDPWSEITVRVRDAMVDGTCGPTLEIDMAHYTYSEQLTIAATLTRIAITGYSREKGK